MIVLSNSKIKAWKQCPQNFYYKEVVGIEPRMAPPALRRGVLIHSMLEYYYNKKPWTIPLGEFQKSWDDLLDEEKDYYGGDLPEEAARMMSGYVTKYENHNDQVLAVELNFRETPVEIIPGIAFKGVIDLIMKNEKGTWIVEHKTCKKIPSEDQRFLDMQTIIYTLVAEKLGYKVDGILWNYVRTKPPTIPRVLKNGGLSRAKDIDTDYDTYYQAIIQNGEDPETYKEELQRASQNTFYVRKYMPLSDRVMKAIITDIKTVAYQIDKLKNYPFRALNKMTCGMCSYKSLCQAEMLGLDSSLIMKHDFKLKVNTREEVLSDEED